MIEGGRFEAKVIDSDVLIGGKKPMVSFDSTDEKFLLKVKGDGKLAKGCEEGQYCLNTVRFYLINQAIDAKEPLHAAIVLFEWRNLTAMGPISMMFTENTSRLSPS